MRARGGISTTAALIVIIAVILVIAVGYYMMKANNTTNSGGRLIAHARTSQSITAANKVIYPVTVDLENRLGKSVTITQVKAVVVLPNGTKVTLTATPSQPTATSGPVTLDVDFPSQAIPAGETGSVDLTITTTNMGAAAAQITITGQTADGKTVTAKATVNF